MKNDAISSYAALGFPILQFTPEQFTAAFLRIVMSAPALGSSVIAHLNAHALYLLRADPAFERAMRSFDYVFCDGYGAALAIWAESGHWPCRRTYAGFIQDWLRELERTERRVFVLGYTDEQLTRIVKVMQGAYPRLKLAGWHHGFFDLHSNMRDLIARIRSAAPDVLFIGMGMPRQEVVAARLVHELDACTIVPLGAGLLHVAGLEARGPRFLTDHGFEWLWRLLREPRRLMCRTVKSNLAVLVTIASTVRKRLAGTRKNYSLLG